MFSALYQNVFARFGDFVGILSTFASMPWQQFLTLIGDGGVVSVVNLWTDTAFSFYFPYVPLLSDILSFVFDFLTPTELIVEPVWIVILYNSAIIFVVLAFFKFIASTFK